MTTFAQRRLRNLAFAGMMIGLIVAVGELYDMSMRDPDFLNGWILFASIVFMMLFNLRKKLIIVPLMRVSAWLQLHVYVGVVCIFLFLIHTEFSLPSGTFETILWCFFVAINVSGVIGVLLSRLLPHRISARGERVLFERIPILRAQIARQVQDLAMLSVKETRGETIAEFYVAQLAPFMQRPRHLFGHIIGANRPERRLHVEIRERERYLDDRGRQILEEIDQLITAKSDLDYQYAMQLTLKGWLFFHLPLNYGLLLFMLAHVMIVYGFSAGAP
jgi:hypothetical protein